jgi:FKBP-type peptidyl-prolyl cis-trans isomerase
MNKVSKNSLVTVAAFISTVSSLLAQENTKPAVAADPKTLQQDMSYGLGFQNGEQFASFGFIADDLDKEAYIKGLIEALMKKDFARDPGAYDQAMKAYDKIVTKREQELAAANEAAEKVFLEKNGKRKEVVTTDSGLQYEILKQGDGKKYSPPEGLADGMDQTTLFHLICTGKMLDGTVFTQTPADVPTPFDLQVIPGLAEALKMMPVGSKWKLYLPAELGIGDLRQGPKISPKSMLIYDVELTKIQASAVQPNLDIPQPLIPR